MKRIAILGSTGSIGRSTLSVVESLTERCPAAGSFPSYIQCILNRRRGGSMATSMVHIRVDEKVKAKAARTLAAMGLTVSDAVRLLLTRIAAEKALPFEVRVPNRQTAAAMEAGERGQVSRASSIAEMMADLNAHD